MIPIYTLIFCLVRADRRSAGQPSVWQRHAHHFRYRVFPVHLIDQARQVALG